MTNPQAATTVCREIIILPGGVPSTTADMAEIAQIGHMHHPQTHHIHHPQQHHQIIAG